jgi:hypothetical protein
VQIPRLRAARSARDDHARTARDDGAWSPEHVIPSERSESRDLHPIK